MVKVRYYGIEFIFDEVQEAELFAKTLVNAFVDTTGYVPEAQVSFRDIDGMDTTVTYRRAKDETDTSECADE